MPEKPTFHLLEPGIARGHQSEAGAVTSSLLLGCEHKAGADSHIENIALSFPNGT